MSDYFIYAQGAIGAPGPVTASETKPKWPLGYTALGIDRGNSTGSAASAGVGEFVYCRGSNAASAGAFVHIQNASALLLAAANSVSNFPIGVACAVLTATSHYGWVQVAGRVDYARGTNTANTAGIPRYICAGTPGIVVSDVVAGNRIQGLCVPANQTSTAAVSASGVYDLNRPFVAGLTAAF
jgi:hypothetical protein